jgi:DNA invertase Pin-like site-specific DNA recombinase
LKEYIGIKKERFVMSKVYGYCRTARAGNMEEQIELVSNYCKAKGLDLVTCFCDDGVSAHNLSREELDKLFGVLKDGDVVVTKDPSRFARDPQKQQLLINKICDIGVEIAYIDEKEEDDKIGIEAWAKQRWAK